MEETVRKMDEGRREGESGSGSSEEGSLRERSDRWRKQ